MKRTARVLTVAAAFFASAGSALPDCGFSPLNGVTLRADLSKAAVNQVNALRSGQGLSTLAVSPMLTKAAMSQALALAQGRSKFGNHAAIGRNLIDCNVSNFAQEVDESGWSTSADAVKDLNTGGDFPANGDAVTIGVGVARATDGTIFWVFIAGFASDESGDPYAGIPTVSSQPQQKTKPTAPKIVLLARPDHAVVKAGHAIMINVLANDRHSPADHDLVVLRVTTPAHGHASVFNLQQVRYTAPAGFHGTVKLRYQIARDGKNAWGVVTITVR